MYYVCIDHKFVAIEKQKRTKSRFSDLLNNFFEIGKNILHLAPIGATDFAQILWVAHSFI